MHAFLDVKLDTKLVSKLFRNVPFLTSIEMSPFSFCTSFCFFRLLLLKNFSLASPRSDDPLLGRTTGSLFFCHVGLARSVALRSPQGELGRSAGPGQRRARRGGGPLGSSLLHLRAGRFMPRMAGRRRPLTFLDRNRYPWGRLAGCCLKTLRLY